MTPRLRSGIAALALLVALGGCGDDDDPVPDGEDAADVERSATDESGGTTTEAPEDEEVPAGGGGDDTFVEPAVDDLVSSGVEPDVARCIATAILDAAGGPGGLQEAGLDAETWFTASESFEELGLPADDEAVDGLAEGLGECGDGFELLFTASGEEVSDQVRSCVTDAVDEADVRHQLAASIIRSEPEGDVFEVVSRCEDDATPG